MCVCVCGGGGGGVTLTSSRKDWARFYGCINQVSNDQSLQWQSVENLTVCLSLSVWENEWMNKLYFKWVNIKYRHHLYTYRHEWVKLYHIWLDMYSRASLLRTLYMNKPLLYSGHWRSFLVSMSTMYLNFDRKKTRLEREREGENSNSKSPFYKDCSPGLVKSSRTSDQLI